MRKIIKLTGYCGQLPIDTLHISVNSIEINYEFPTEIEWNSCNILQIRINDEKESCKIVNLPLSKTVEYNNLKVSFSIVEV